jgi:hypothetical protein
VFAVTPPLHLVSLTAALLTVGYATIGQHRWQFHPSARERVGPFVFSILIV